MYIKNNIVFLEGVVLEEPTYSHTKFHETFYLIRVRVERFSGEVDEIPVLIADNVYDVFSIRAGQWLSINGQYRSYNRWDSDGTHLILSVYACEIRESDVQEYDNRIYLNGYVCKNTTWRKTPLGKEITDMMVAVNRSFGKSDYIPCICWNRDSKAAAEFPVGTRINVIGRIQSREYMKQYVGREAERKIAYEVSVSKIIDVEMPRKEENDE